MQTVQADVLRNARLLGYSGVLPLFIGVLMAWTVSRPEPVLESMHSYAAVILSFVGAIHWGRAIENNNTKYMLWSVIPALVAWMTLAYPPAAGVPAICVMFLAAWGIDYRTYHRVNWFRRLRTHLTLTVCACLILGWIAVV